MIKKFFIVLISVILLCAAAAAVFFVTFDANRYKGLISQGLEKALGKPVEIGNVGLAWDGGIALAVSKLAVYSDASKSASPGLSVDSVSVRVRLMPLLQKNIQIVSIVVAKPFADISREADGRILVGGINFAKSSAPAAPAGTASAAGTPAFLVSIDTVSIRAARVLFHDRSGPSPLNLEIKNADAYVKNFSLDKSFTFQAAASVLSDRQNLKISGGMTLPHGSADGLIQNVVITTDLADMDVQKMAQTFPAFASAGIREKMRGIFSIEVGKLVINPQSIAAAKADIFLKNGRIVPAGLGAAVDPIEMTAVAGPAGIQLNHFTANVEGGLVDLSGTAVHLGAAPGLTIKGSVKDLPVSQLVKNLNPKAPQLSGHLAVSIDGTARGLDWNTISKTLSGNARVQMSDGVLLNYNFLKAVIDKLSAIPGAESAIQNHFPQAYRARLDDKSTILKPVDLSAKITNGVFRFDSFQIASDFVQISGSGNAALDRSLSFRANLILNREISQAFAGAFSPAQLLCDSQGQITVPVEIAGELPQVKIIPDTQYITSKLLAGKTQEMVQQLVSDPQNSLNKIQDIFKKNVKGLNL